MKKHELTCMMEDDDSIEFITNGKKKVINVFVKVNSSEDYTNVVLNAREFLLMADKIREELEL
ncbi:hypothetical protein [Bacillus wiedmannii]|uniref:hypothetical protein n=1 Tax=Bacillus wiedmannii TaxID=1890302 RepID=UPI0002F0E575|nr:hypothetical protein [Bacillus wiedmannii]